MLADYARLLDPLLDDGTTRVRGITDSGLVGPAQSFESLTRAVEAVALQQSLLTPVLARGAFDPASRPGTAVALDAEQAALRRNVNDVFVNLGRRNQNLITRQLAHIDQAEAKTDDPDALADLFLLDHLATRMRRNAENMLVIAGADSPRPWARPVSIVNVVRAAVARRPTTPVSTSSAWCPCRCWGRG